VIILPSLKTVVILIPRTGSGSLYRAIKATHPDAMMLYRHMEAYGCPRPYLRWQRVGVVRHPLIRMVSMYDYLKDYGASEATAHFGVVRAAALRESVKVPFKEWFLNNNVVFGHPWGNREPGEYHPKQAVEFEVPENRKSQYDYLISGVGEHGLEIYKFGEWQIHADLTNRLRLPADTFDGQRKNASRVRTDHSIESLLGDREIHAALMKHHRWDMDYFAKPDGTTL